MNNRRTRYEASIDKSRAVTKADDAGEVADSMAVRTELIRRMHAGELTLEEMQAELARIKRNAKKEGKLTRSQVWNRA